MFDIIIPDRGALYELSDDLQAVLTREQQIFTLALRTPYANPNAHKNPRQPDEGYSLLLVIKD